MKFSKKFERDYEWYVSISDIFDFDGVEDYTSKAGIPMIQYSKQGMSAKECFYLFDSQGIVKKTKEPKRLKKLYKTKGSVNLHIKMYAEDRASGLLPETEFRKIVKEINPPKWFVDAVENQKGKFYEKYFE